MDRRGIEGEGRNEAECDTEDRVPGGDEDGLAATRRAREQEDRVDDDRGIEPAEQEPDREPDRGLDRWVRPLGQQPGETRTGQDEPEPPAAAAAYVFEAHPDEAEPGQEREDRGSDGLTGRREARQAPRRDDGDQPDANGRGDADRDQPARRAQPGLRERLGRPRLDRSRSSWHSRRGPGPHLDADRRAGVRPALEPERPAERFDAVGQSPQATPRCEVSTAAAVIRHDEME